MKKKYIIILSYAVVLWVASWLIFGESGVIETSLKQKEILRLKAEIQASTEEVENMGRQYRHLRVLLQPDQNFLAGVDRKLQDIVIYKFPPRKAARISEKEERHTVLQALLMGGVFVIIGIISITALTISVKPHERGSL